MRTFKQSVFIRVCGNVQLQSVFITWKIHCCQLMLNAEMGNIKVLFQYIHCGYTVVTYTTQDFKDKITSFYPLSLDFYLLNQEMDNVYILIYFQSLVTPSALPVYLLFTHHQLMPACSLHTQIFAFPSSLEQWPQAVSDPDPGAVWS